MTPNNLLKAALAAALSLVPVTSEATLMRAVPFDEKVENSATIVVGRCVKTEARWDAQKRQILTYSTFAVEKALKGGQQKSETMVVVTPGGSLDGVHQDAIGVPTFTVGEDSLLFVRNSAAGPTVAYLEQGAYDVVSEGNERMVRPSMTEAVHVDTQRGMAVAAEEPRTLRAFEGEVRAAERRAFQRMQLMKQKQEEEASLWGVVKRNGLLVALAAIGIALATWQLLRK